VTIRAPHLSGKRPRKVQQPEIVTNLLVTTLVVVAAPFVANEQTIPQRVAIQQPFQVGSPLALIEGAGEKPFAQLEWPNPEPLGRQQPDQRDAFLPRTVPVVRTHDWPNPTLAVKVQQPEVIQLSPALLAVPEKPGAQLDWPNPTVLPLVQQPFQVGSSYALIGDAGEKPFAQYDWPTPPAILTKFPEQKGQPAVITAIFPKPFLQSDWPNPTVSTKIQTPFQVGASLTLIEDAGEKPFAFYDWPVPPAIPTKFPEQIGQSAVLTEVFPAPFFQTEWPNPTVAIKIQSPFQVGSSLTLIEDAGEKPFDQLDWINPPPKPTQQPFQLPKPIVLIETVDVDAVIIHDFRSDAVWRLSIESGGVFFQQTSNGVWRLPIESDGVDL